MSENPLTVGCTPCTVLYGVESRCKECTLRTSAGGIGMAAAREKVRVGGALEHLPKVCAVFETGELSYSKVRALTRVANPENEEYLLAIARHGTAAHLEKLVRSYRWVERQEELERSNRQHEDRRLNYYYDEDGSLVIKVRLPAEQGAVVLKAINEAVEAIRKDVSAEGSQVQSISTEGVTAETCVVQSICISGAGVKCLSYWPRQ